MGRYYSGDINGKFWFGVQDSNAIEQLGGVVEEPILKWDGCDCDYDEGEIMERHFNNLKCRGTAFTALSQTILSQDIVEKIDKMVVTPNPCYCGNCFNSAEEHMEEAGYDDISDWEESHTYEDNGARMWIDRDNEIFSEKMLEMKNTIEKWDINLKYEFTSHFEDEVRFKIDEGDNFYSFNHENLPQDLDDESLLDVYEIIADYTMGLLIEEYFRLNPEQEKCEFWGEY